MGKIIYLAGLDWQGVRTIGSCVEIISSRTEDHVQPHIPRTLSLRTQLGTSVGIHETRRDETSYAPRLPIAKDPLGDKDYRPIVLFGLGRNQAWRAASNDRSLLYNSTSPPPPTNALTHHHGLIPLHRPTNRLPVLPTLSRPRSHLHIHRRASIRRGKGRSLARQDHQDRRQVGRRSALPRRIDGSRSR
jgi:hypothetical protein